jgi:undecaprenyl-diphosphatase
LSLLEAIILGIIQGLTEFLPVSSSGHLELAKALMGNEQLPDESLLFTVVVHFATAMSTVVVFRKDIAEIFRGLFQFKNNDALQFSLKIIVSMLPAAFVGLVFNDEIEALFSGQVLLVGAMLTITALLLLFADRATRSEKSVSYSNALVIGVAQAIAILPGISRSGATIATSVLLGIDRAKAARFSFLMVVPLIFGKIAKDLLDGGESLAMNGQASVYLVGFVAAFLTGLFACNLMISLVKRSQLRYFAWYCFVAGGLAIVLALFL